MSKNVKGLKGHKVMKRSSARVAALGLSTITLAGTVAFPVHAEASEDSESLLFVPSESNEQQTRSEESAVVEDASDLSNNANEQLSDSVADEEIPEANEAKGEIDNALESVTNIEKSKEAMDVAEDTAEALADSSVDNTKATMDSSSKALEVATQAESAVLDANTSKDEAVTILADAQNTYTQASENYLDAKASYDDTLAKYEEAKEDYNTAVNAYNANKDKAINSLDSAKDSLSQATERLDKISIELEEARQALVDAGAEALITVDDNKEDVTSYVETIVRYYYAPNNELTEGQQITDYQVTKNGEDYLTISYNIVDADGNILRNVTADYGYELDKDSGEIRIYDNQLYYEYTDAEGQVVRITKEEANKLEDNRVQIGSYYTATGFYIPRYQETARYQGIISKIKYSDAKAIAQCKEAVEDEYSDNRYFYNTDVDFIEGTKTGWLLHYDLDIYYDVSYDQVETYYLLRSSGGYDEVVKHLAKSGKKVISSSYEYDFGIVRFIQEYQVEDAKEKEYGTYQDALKAIKEEANKKYGASDIDLANSTNLNIAENIKYATLQEAHVNADNPLFGSSDEKYSSYMTSIRSKLSNYAKLLSEVNAALVTFVNAKNQVESLKNQISNLNGADTIKTGATLAALEAKLEKANLNLDRAKDNLAAAKTKLDNASAAYEERFNTVSTAPSTIITPVNDIKTYIEATSQEDMVDEEMTAEDEGEITEETVITTNNINNSTGTNAGGNGDGTNNDGEISDTPEDTSNEQVPVITIPDEETPRAITIAGILARGKWFIGLAGVSTAGIGVAVLEAKHRAAIKLLDKLNQ